MTRSKLMTTAHKNAAKNNMWQFKTYCQKLAYELRRLHAINKSTKLQGKKVLVKALNVVAYVKCALNGAFTLVDTNGSPVWNCSNSTGLFTNKHILFTF